MRRECAFNFAGFDTEAAPLDLVIGAAEVFEVAVGKESDAIAGAVQTRADFVY